MGATAVGHYALIIANGACWSCVQSVDDMNLVRHRNDANDFEICEPMLEWA